jgi:hypothetical protein
MTTTKLYYVGPKDEHPDMADKLVFYAIVEAVSEEQAKELFLQLFDHVPAERVGAKAIEKAEYPRVVFYEWAAIKEWLSSDEKGRLPNPAFAKRKERS